MALTSGDVPTAVGIYQGSQNRRDVEKLLAKLFTMGDGFLSKTPIRGQAVNIKHEWFEAKLIPSTFTASFDNATTTLNITDPSSTSDVQKRLRKYAVAKPSNADFYVRFDNDPVTGNNTVSVIYGTGADVSSTTWEVVSLPHADEDNPTDPMLQFDTNRYNIVQLFERTIQITKTGLKMQMYPDQSGEQWIKDQISRKLKEIKIEMDKTAIMGVASNVTDARRTMAGFIQQIRDPDLDGTKEDTMYYDASGASVSAEILNAMIKQIYDAGGIDGSSKPYLVCNATQLKKLAALDEAIRRADIADRSMGYAVKSFVSFLGVDIPILSDRYVPDDKILVVDFSRIKWVPLRGDNLALEQLAKTNSRITTWQLAGSYTLVVEHAESAHGVIGNLATS